MTELINKNPSATGESPAIVITDKAANQVKRLLEKEGLLVSHALRVKVVGGGCSGLSYSLEFDEPTGEDVKLRHPLGFAIAIDQGSREYLNGTVLDFEENFGGGGFTFRNPNAVSTCGCGVSFAV